MRIRTLIVLALLASAGFFALRISSNEAYVFSRSNDGRSPPSIAAVATSSVRTETAPPALATSTPAKKSTAAASSTSTSSQDAQAILQKVAGQLNDIGNQINAAKPKSPPRTRVPAQELFTYANDRVVNFFCQAGSGERIVATGMIVSAQGHIMTNAHVAAEAPATCLVRIGSPARDYAYATRVFLPDHYTATSTDTVNVGRDVSIWEITSSATANPLPSPFPFVSIDPTYAPRVGDHLSTFSYPAELLGYQAITSALYLTFSETIVDEVTPIYIRSAQGLGSQEGSSGGMLLDPYTRTFAGMIFGVNSVAKGDISERKLFSLTPAAIDKTVLDQTGKHLKEYLNSY